MKKTERKLNLIAEYFRFDPDAFPDQLSESDDELNEDELDLLAAAGVPEFRLKDGASDKAKNGGIKR